MTRPHGFEPAGTAPEYQRHGLGPALLYERMCRLRRLGATMATVVSKAAGPRAFYARARFVVYEEVNSWEKRL